ncbi:hypothetical protein ILYODFUR_034742 [Ilyodon furcidens]|uniref:Uncharacterized protein n=1 Tax=Ilyodon furcidens TaxID=33524 RepID=A0ABV0UYR7_9TELE
MASRASLNIFVVSLEFFEFFSALLQCVVKSLVLSMAVRLIQLTTEQQSVHITAQFSPGQPQWDLLLNRYQKSQYRAGIANNGNGYKRDEWNGARVQPRFSHLITYQQLNPEHWYCTAPPELPYGSWLLL